MRFRFWTGIGIFLLLAFHSFGQNIAFISLSNDLTVCGPPKAMGMVYQNTTPDTLKGVMVVIQFPQGVNYVPGSFGGNGMSEGSISQVDSITLFAPDLPPFQSDTFRVLMRAQCDAADSSSVNNFVRIFYTTGADSIVASPFNILKPVLSIQSITPSSFTGPVGSVFQRCVSVVNGGYGELTTFSIVMESSVASLSHSGFFLSANGAVLSPTISGDSIIFTITQTEIEALGDLDSLFEQNEVLEICFQVTVDDCIDLATIFSANWGCGGFICENQSTTANINVPALVPNLVVTDLYEESRCYGSALPSRIKIILQNNGTGPARDVEIDLWQGEPTGPSNGYISRLDTFNILLKDAFGGITQIAPFAVENQASGSFLGCLGPNPIRRLKVSVPFIQPGERDTLIVEQYTCCKDWCASGPAVMQRTHYQVNYNDRCYSSNYVIPANIVTSWNFGRVLSFTNSGLNDIPLGDTADYAIEHSDFRFYNFSPGAYAWIDIVVPPGLIALSTPGSIYFEDIQGDLWNSTNIVAIGDTVRAFFDLPKPGNVSLEKILLKFRLTNDCSGGPCSSGPKTVEYSVHQVADTSCSCKVTVGCHDFVVNSHCGICPATCQDGGMIFLGFDSYRKNYGLPDNDNNGVADGFGVIDMSKVRTRHLMLRDTLRTEFHGIVQTTLANPFWTEGIARSVITRGNRLTPVSYTIRIVDASAGATYSATLPAPTFTTSGTTRTFTYSLNTATLGGSVPPGFQYEVNDSVEVVCDYVVASNLGSVVEAQSITNTFALQTPGGGLVAGCDDFSGGFVLVGYYYTSSGPNEFSVSGCNTVTVTENYYLSIGNCCSNYAGGNIFVYEYRHWGIPGIGRFIVPAGYTFQSANIRHYRTTGTQSTGNTFLPLTPFAISGDTIFFDLAANFTSSGGTIPLGDDGYYGIVNAVLEPSCEVVPDILQPVKYLWSFEPITELTGSGSVNPASSRVDSIAYEGPSFTINPALPTTPGINSTVSWEFNLENNSNTAAAGNSWFSLVSPSGQISITSVEDLRTNSFLTPVGGLYQIGNLPADSSWGYRIIAEYNNCTTDSLQIVAGWDCSAYPANLGAYPCTPATSWLYIQPQPAVLQANLTVDPGTHDICDSLLVELQVVSSQTASLRDIQIEVRLPLTGGLTFSTGSGEMQYPVSGSFTSIANPAIIGNRLIWDVNTINAIIAANDLPGAIRPDSNVFNLRFYLYTNCDMISGDRFSVRLQALQGCGDPVNPVLILSQPIQINGAIQPYVTQVAASRTVTGTCPQTETMTVEIINAGLSATNAGDSIFVNLSPGYTFSGGFLGQVNPPANPSPDIITGPGGTRLGWEMPTGIVAGDTIRYSYSITVGDAVPCGPEIATVQTVTNQILFCARTSSNCSASTQTGSFVLNMNVVRPDLDFTSFNATIQPVSGGYDYLYNGTISNSGTNLAAGNNTVVQFYCDSDNSGGYSVGDTPLGTYSTTTGIANGGSHSFGGGFFIPNGSCTPSNMIYGLIVPNSAGGYCICDTTFGNSNVVLPQNVLTIRGEAQPAGNKLEWEESILENSIAFEVERLSETGWITLSPQIPNQGATHAWLDLEPGLRENYRVKAILPNGGMQWSNAIQVLRLDFANLVRAYPNPASGIVHFEAPAGTQFVLWNTFGQQVLSGIVGTDGSASENIAQLPAGVYPVEFRLGTERIVRQLVIAPIR